MMKLCVIGNSHVGALRLAWIQVLNKRFGDIEMTCFAHRGSGIAHMKVEGKSLIPENPLMARAIKFTSEGKDKVNVADYDAFVVYGLHEGSFDRGDNYFSSAVQAAAMKDRVLNQGNHILLTKLRQITDKPVFAAHDPLPALPEEGLLPADPPYEAQIALMQRLFYAPLDVTLIAQPQETILQGRATQGRFTKGSEQLAIGDDGTDGRTHGANEIQHMNADYGALWLEAFLPRFGA